MAAEALTPERLVARARSLASALPDLRMEARRIAMTINAGWHGRRRAGPGETFWQFRDYAPGEPASRIDWRRSARGRQLYVRESEWEAAHTLRLAADLSPSMAFASPEARAPKAERALLLALVVAELSVAGAERVGVLGQGRARTGAQAVDLIARTLADQDGAPLPDRFDVRRYDDVVLFSDFLMADETREALFDRLAAAGARAHLVHIIDPAEEHFPFTGRTDFLDPESGRNLIAPRADRWQAPYRDLFAAFKAELAASAARRGFRYLAHHSDQPASGVAIALHRALGLPPDAP